MCDDSSEIRMAEIILRQGELYLQGTLSIALASDSRAATLAAVFAGGSVATIGVLSQIDGDVALQASGGAFSLLWFIAAVTCLSVLWPCKLHLPGNYPSLWLVEDVKNGPLVEALFGECENYDARIKENISQMAKLTSRFKVAVTLAVCAPPLSLLVWLATKLP